MHINSDKNFFYIIGNPRSGTSLLRIMLDSHQEITVPPECGFLHWLSDKYKSRDFSKLNQFVNEYLIDLCNSKKIETWNIDFNKLRNYIDSTKPVSYFNLCMLVYLIYAYKFGKNPRVVGDKNNYYIKHIYELDEISQNAKYILIVRDCRDVVQSYRELRNLKSDSPYKPNLNTDPFEISKEWTENNKNILKFFNQISKDRYFIIRFEDLIMSTRQTLINICKWLDLDFDDKMMRYYLENKEKELEPASTLDWKMNTLKKPMQNKVGIYKETLSDEEVDKVNQVANEMLTRFSYI